MELIEKINAEIEAEFQKQRKESKTYKELRGRIHSICTDVKWKSAELGLHINKVFKKLFDEEIDGQTIPDRQTKVR